LPKKIKWLQLKKYFTIKVKVKINLEGAKTLQNISLLCNLGTLTIIRKKFVGIAMEKNNLILVCYREQLR